MKRALILLALISTAAAGQTTQGLHWIGRPQMHEWRLADGMTWTAVSVLYDRETKTYRVFNLDAEVGSARDLDAAKSRGTQAYQR